MTREWKVGDRALLPVVVLGSDVTGTRVEYAWGPNPRVFLTRPTDLIPDDRRPSWLPGQPGDVAEWDGRQWTCEDGAHPFPWITTIGQRSVRLIGPVPADAVLVLPATTREAQ